MSRKMYKFNYTKMNRVTCWNIPVMPEIQKTAA